jgi:hypothetical protein
MRQAMPAFRSACSGIETAPDPNGVIAAGPLRHRHAMTRAAAYFR